MDIDYKISTGAMNSELANEATSHSKYLQKVKVCASSSDLMIGNLSATAINAEGAWDDNSMERVFSTSDNLTALYSMLFGQDPYSYIRQNDGFSHNVWQTLVLNGAPYAPGLDVFPSKGKNNYFNRFLHIESISVDENQSIEKIAESLIIVMLDYKMNADNGIENNSAIDLISIKLCPETLGDQVDNLKIFQVLVILGFMPVLGCEQWMIATPARLSIISSAYFRFNDQN